MFSLVITLIIEKFICFYIKKGISIFRNYGNGSKETSIKKQRS